MSRPPTTDEGVAVPFIVRVETGYIDRDQYQVATLFQPGEPWKATKPQEQFNGKLLITHGFGCGVDYKPGDGARGHLAAPPRSRSGAGSRRCRTRSTTAATTATSPCRRSRS